VLRILLTDNDEKNGELPSDVRNMIKEFISDTTEESLNLVVNISGVYFDKSKRKQFKEKVKQETAPDLEEWITKNILLGKQMSREIQLKEVTGADVKEKIYRFFENMRPTIEDIPEEVNVFEYMMSTLKEVKDIRFELSYLEKTKYFDYIVMIEDLLERIDEESNIGSTAQFIWNFINTNDAYALMQSVFHKISEYYMFLEREHQTIKKEQVSKYLEIYDGLVGHFEKLVYLLVGLVKTFRKDLTPEYDNIKKKRLFPNLMFLKSTGYNNLVSGFNRSIRNALVHENCKINLINEVVVFYDIGFEFEMSFKELQQATRELSANLLIIPNLIILTFYLALSRFKEILDKLE
jgi:hypothetical protein